MGYIERLKARREFALKATKTIMGQLKVDPNRYADIADHPDFCGSLRQDYWGKLAMLLRERSDEALGKLAACGLEYNEDTRGRETSLAETSRFVGVLSERESGYDLLLKICGMTIIAAMRDVIREKLAKSPKRI